MRIDVYHHNNSDEESKEIKLLRSLHNKVDQLLSPAQNKISGFISSLSIFDGKQLLFTFKGKLNIMALSMKDTQQAAGVLSFVDKKGAKTDVPDGNVTVTSSDTNVATATYDDPSNTVTVVAVNPGVAALTIVAKDSNGNTLPFDDVAVEITAGDAVSGSIAFGEPTEQP